MGHPIEMSTEGRLNDDFGGTLLSTFQANWNRNYRILEPGGSTKTQNWHQTRTPFTVLGAVSRKSR